MTGMVTDFWISLILLTGDIRATPPSRRISEGTRSSAMTAAAPASSAIFACSWLVTSMMTPPLSISASPMCLRSAMRSPFSSDMCGLLLALYHWNRRALHPIPVAEPAARGFYRLGQPPDTLIDPAGRHRRERQPQGLPATAVHEERRTGGERDAALDRLRQERTCVHSGRQRDQQREAAVRLGPGDLGRHAPPQRRQQERATARVLRGDAGRVAVEELALAEPVHRRLDEGTRVQVGQLLGSLEPLEDGTGPDEPAQAQAREQDLRERADVDDDSAAVDRFERQGRRATVVEAAVEPVLYDRHLMAGRRLQEAPCRFRRHREPGRIVRARLAIEELRRVALQEPLEQVGAGSGAVPRHAQELRAERPEDLHRARVRRLLDGDEVARIDQRAGDQVEPLLRAVDDEDLIGPCLEAEPQEVRREVLAKLRIAPGRIVLQERRALLADDLVQDSTERVGREKAAVRHPAGKRDDRAARGNGRDRARALVIGAEDLRAAGEEAGPVERDRGRGG